MRSDPRASGPAFALVAAAFLACAGPQEATPVAAPAEVSPPDVLLEDLDGVAFDPFAVDDPAAIVFLFARTDCPISNRYAPEVRALYDEFAPADVAFRLVYADPDETVTSIRASVLEYDYPMPASRDVRQDLVRWADARITPEAAVYVPGRGLVYRGRIDDRYVAFGQARAQASRRDVHEVLTAVLAGEPPAFRRTEAIGCAIRRIE